MIFKDAANVAIYVSKETIGELCIQTMRKLATATFDHRIRKIKILICFDPS